MSEAAERLAAYLVYRRDGYSHERSIELTGIGVVRDITAPLPPTFDDHLRTVLAENAELRAEVERLRLVQFAPMGDNHHNAAVCPYCSPDDAELRAEVERLRCDLDTERSANALLTDAWQAVARLDAVRRVCDERDRAGEFPLRIRRSRILAALASPPSGPEVSE